MILLRQRRNRRVQVKRLLDLPGQRLQGSQQFLLFAFHTPQLSRKIDGQQIQHRHLGGIAFRRGHGNFRTGPGVYGIIRQLGYRAANHIDDRQGPGSFGFAFLQGRNGVCCFPGLGYHNNQRLLINERITVTQFAGQHHFHRNAAQLFDGIFPGAARIIGRTAGGNDNLADLPDFRSG